MAAKGEVSRCAQFLPKPWPRTCLKQLFWLCGLMDLQEAKKQNKKQSSNRECSEQGGEFSSSRHLQRTMKAWRVNFGSESTCAILPKEGTT